MGDRGQVYVEEAEVYLYTNWTGSTLFDTVLSALRTPAGQERSNDPVYLARIIFEYMIDEAGARGKSTGFGLSGHKFSDINVLVTVDCRKKLVIEQNFDSEERASSFPDGAST